MSNAALKSSSTKMTPPPPPHYQRPRIGHFVHEEVLSLCCGVACKQTEISHMSCLFSNALLIEHKQCVQQGNKVWNKWGVGVEGVCVWGGGGGDSGGGGGGVGVGGGWGWVGGWLALLMSESVGKCHPLDPLFHIRYTLWMGIQM